MREPKYKAWDELGKRMYSWDEIESIEKNPKGELVVVVRQDEGIRMTGRLDLLEFAGPKDMKGTGFCEGDIVEYPETVANPAGKCVIEYDEDEGKFIGKRHGFAQDVSMYWLSDFGKIIGNAWDNPELPESAQFQQERREEQGREVLEGQNDNRG